MTTVGGVEARDIEVAVVDLAHLPKAWDGIIGNNFMKDYKVIIDYPRQKYHSRKRPDILSRGVVTRASFSGIAE